MYSSSTIAQSSGFLRIKVNVPNVTVTVNGAAFGEISPTAGILKELPSGTYLIEGQKDGYLDVTQPVNLRPGGITEISLQLVKRPPKAGYLKVYATFDDAPVQASVFVDGIFAGKSPLQKKLLTGQYKVTVVNDTINRLLTAVIAEHDTTRLSIELDNRAEVLISVDLRYAEQEWLGYRVTIEGHGTYYPLARLKLRSGQYKVKLEKDGWQPAETILDVNSKNSYAISAGPSVNLPRLTGADIGRPHREHIKPESLMKREYYYQDQSHSLGGSVLGGALLGLLTSGAAGEPDEWVSYSIGGGVLGIAVWAAQEAKPDAKKTDKSAVEYNKTEVPRLLRAKNGEIDAYNAETARLVQAEARKKNRKLAVAIIENGVSKNTSESAVQPDSIGIREQNEMHETPPRGKESVEEQATKKIQSLLRRKDH